MRVTKSSEKWSIPIRLGAFVPRISVHEVKYLYLSAEHFLVPDHSRKTQAKGGHGCHVYMTCPTL